MVTIVTGRFCGSLRFANSQMVQNKLLRLFSLETGSLAIDHITTHAWFLSLSIKPSMTSLYALDVYQSLSKYHVLIGLKPP